MEVLLLFDLYIFLIKIVVVTGAGCVVYFCSKTCLKGLSSELASSGGFHTRWSFGTGFSSDPRRR